MTMTEIVIALVIGSASGWFGRGGWDRWRAGIKVVKLPRLGGKWQDIGLAIALIVTVLAAVVAGRTSACVVSVVGDQLDYQNSAKDAAAVFRNADKNADEALQAFGEAAANQTPQAQTTKLFLAWLDALAKKNEARDAQDNVTATHPLPTRNDLKNCLLPWS